MKQILVVDDNAASLALVRENLKEHYKVTLVTDGNQALRFLERKHPDLILLDVFMPVMDGVEVLKKMKELPDFDIPVVMLTSTEEDEILAQCRALNVSGFLSKPFEPAKMLALLAQLLGKDE